MNIKIKSKGIKPVSLDKLHDKGEHPLAFVPIACVSEAGDLKDNAVEHLYFLVDEREADEDERLEDNFFRVFHVNSVQVYEHHGENMVYPVGLDMEIFLETQWKARS